MRIVKLHIIHIIITLAMVVTQLTVSVTRSTNGTIAIRHHTAVLVRTIKQHTRQRQVILLRHVPCKT